MEAIASGLEAIATSNKKLLETRVRSFPNLGKRSRKLRTCAQWTNQNLSLPPRKGICSQLMKNQRGSGSCELFATKASLFATASFNSIYRLFLLASLLLLVGHLFLVAMHLLLVASLSPKLGV